MAPRRHQEGSRMAPRQSEKPSKTAKTASNGLQHNPKTLPRRPRRPQDNPSLPKYVSKVADRRDINY
eukprot:3715008-Pyramimonas_sp.AAC.1